MVVFKKYPDLNGTWKGYYNASIFFGKNDKSINNKVENQDEITPEILKNEAYNNSKKAFVLNVENTNNLESPESDVKKK